MVDELDFDQKLKTRIDELVQLKSGKNESYIHAAERELNIFIQEQLAKADEKAPALAGRKNKNVNLNEFFRHGLKHIGNDNKGFKRSAVDPARMHQ